LIFDFWSWCIKLRSTDLAEVAFWDIFGRDLLDCVRTWTTGLAVFHIDRFDVAEVFGKASLALDSEKDGEAHLEKNEDSWEKRTGDQEEGVRWTRDDWVAIPKVGTAKGTKEDGRVSVKEIDWRQISISNEERYYSL
jgi:hypothetical protein